MNKFPSWRFHDKHPAKIIHTELEHAEHEKEGWVDSPAHLGKKAEKKPTKPPVEPPADPDETAELETESSEPEKVDRSKMKYDELKKAVVAKGFDEKELKGKSKADLISLLEG